MLNVSKPDTNTVLLLNKLVTKFREIDLIKAEVYANQAGKYAKNLQFKRGLGQAFQNLGWINYRKGNYSKAFEVTMDAIKINTEIDAKAELAQCFINLAAISFEQQEYDLAIFNFKKAYKLSKEVHDVKAISRSLNNIAYCFVSQHQTDSARFYVGKAMDENEGSAGKYMIGFSKRILGDIFLEEGIPKQAILKYAECLSIAYEIKNNSLITSTLHRLGAVYNTLKQPDKALPFLLKNISIAEQFGYTDELERSYRLAGEAYLLKGNLRDAYAYQSKYIVLRDSTFSKRKNEHVSLMQADLDTQKKQAEIDLLTKDAELKREEINRQRVWMFFYTGCLSLMLMLAYVLYYNNKRFIKMNAKLERQNEYIQGQARLLSNLNNTKDKLFSIISHDLRSPIASLKGLMEVLSRNTLSRDEFLELTLGVKHNIDFLYDDIENLLHWAQSQLKGIQSSPETIFLKGAIDDKFSLFNTIAQNKKIEFINDVEDGVTVLADKNHVSLILRNLITNALKFNSWGGKVRIYHKEMDNRIEVSVSDSGVGMSSEDINRLFNAESHFTKMGTNKEKGMGIGLLITKEFIETNGGSIWVKSEIGKGSTFTFSLKRKCDAALA